MPGSGISILAVLKFCRTSARSLVCLVCLAGLMISGMGQTTEDNGKQFQPAQLREDFALFRKSLEEAHGALYRYTPKAELDRVFEGAEKGLDHPMDALTFWRRLAPVVAAIKCGHTWVLPPWDFYQQIWATEPFLPLFVRVLDDKAYILRDFIARRATATFRLHAG
jgi:hypothetical protein